MNKKIKLLVFTFLLSILFINHSNEKAFAASESDHADSAITVVGAELIRPIKPNKLPGGEGSVTSEATRAPSKLNRVSQGVKYLPKTGSLSNRYALLGLLIILVICTLMKISKRESRG